MVINTNRIITKTPEPTATKSKPILLGSSIFIWSQISQTIGRVISNAIAIIIIKSLDSKREIFKALIPKTLRIPTSFMRVWVLNEIIPSKPRQAIVIDKSEM